MPERDRKIVREVWVIREKATGDIVRFNGCVSWSGKGPAKLSFAAGVTGYGGSQYGQKSKGAWDRQDECELVELLNSYKHLTELVGLQEITLESRERNLEDLVNYNKELLQTVEWLKRDLALYEDHCYD